MSRTVAYVLWPKGAQKPRAEAVERLVLYGFAVFGLMNFWRLLELLPVDEPVDNFMAWQIAQRYHNLSDPSWRREGSLMRGLWLGRRLFALAVVPEIVKQEMIFNIHQCVLFSEMSASLLQELPWDQASDVPHSDDVVLDDADG